MTLIKLSVTFALASSVAFATGTDTSTSTGTTVFQKIGGLFNGNKKNTKTVTQSSTAVSTDTSRSRTGFWPFGGKKVCCQRTMFIKPMNFRGNTLFGDVSIEISPGRLLYQYIPYKVKNYSQEELSRVWTKCANGGQTERFFTNNITLPIMQVKLHRDMSSRQCRKLNESRKDEGLFIVGLNVTTSGFTTNHAYRELKGKELKVEKRVK